MLDHAKGRIDGVRSPWLIGPVRGRLDTFSTDVDATVPQAQVAQQAVAVAPAMLGGNGIRHYFVAFTTESESRGLNGFMGNWGELTAANGKLTMSRTGRVDDLGRAGRRSTRSSRARPSTSPATGRSRWAATSRT